MQSIKEDETMAIVTTNDSIGHCRCSKCDGRIYWKDTYCRHCGRKIVDVEFIAKDGSHV